MTAEAEIHAYWRRIETWLGAHVPPLAKALQPPATAEAIAKAEAAVGVTFPPEFHASLAVHDGQDSGQFEVFGTWGLLDLDSIARKWRMLAEMAAKGTLITADEPLWNITEGPVRPRAWDRAWIPVATKGTGDYLMLDLNPPEGGQRGQIVTYGHSSSVRSVIATDFGAWLGQMAVQLESGTFVVAKGGDRLDTR